MTDRTDTPITPLPCSDCQEKIRVEHAWAYCPHNAALVIAERDADGAFARFVSFGPMTQEQAGEAILHGVGEAAERWRARVVH